MHSFSLQQPELAVLPVILEKLRLTAVISLRILAHICLLLAEFLDEGSSEPDLKDIKPEHNLVLASSHDSAEELKQVDTNYLDNMEYTTSSLDTLQYSSNFLDTMTYTPRSLEIVSSNCEDLCRNRCDSFNSVDSGTGEELELEIDLETGLEIFSLEDVGAHCFPWDAWTVVYDKVYDVTEYMKKHPGGEEVMLEYVGYDATVAFRGVGHSRAAFKVLDKYIVGILPKHERMNLISEH